ncbi:MAG TPA: hypothetical protein VFU21_17530, partial [Kofleriaceae bacterium]|nr:hypothetical protein [Kofleriaceae bacterium]
MARSGRHVVIRRADGARLLDGVELVDALGTAPRRAIAAPGLVDFGCAGEELWVVAAGRLLRYELLSGEPVADPIELGDGPGSLLPAPGDREPAALWSGLRRLLLRAVDGHIEVEDVSSDVPEGAFAAAVAGRRLVIARGRQVLVRDAGRGDVASAALPGADGGPILAGGALFGGRAVAVLSGNNGVSSFDVVRPGGSLVHHIELPKSGRCALAESRGLALLATADARILSIDLRYGRVLADEPAPIAVGDLSIDSNGRFLALAGFRPEGGPLRVLHIPYTDLFASRRPTRVAPPAAVEDAGAEGAAGEEPAAAAPAIAPAAPPEPAVEPPPPEPVPDLPLLSLGSRGRKLNVASPPGVKPYDHPSEHLTDTLELVSAWVARAIADSWDSGRLSLPNQDPRPFQREVMALVGSRMGAAADILMEADKRVEECSRRVGRRAQATLAAGRSLPLVDLALEFGLSDIAIKVLAVAAAPTLRGEIARLYGVLANDEGRPICDRYLIELILAGQDWNRRNQVA